MSKKKKRTATFEIDGKVFHQIEKRTDDGEIDWVKYQSDEKEGLNLSPHVYHKKRERGHVDVYEGKRKVGFIPAQRVRPAGVVIDTVSGEISELPPLLTNKGDFKGKTDLEIAEEYVKRVKKIKEKP